MYKIVYFDGKEVEWDTTNLKTLIKDIAEKNPNVYQIVRNNRTQEVVWEREAPNESEQADDSIEKILEGADIMGVLEAKAANPAKGAATKVFKALDALRKAATVEGLNKVSYTTGKVKREAPDKAAIAKAVESAGVAKEAAGKIADEIVSNINTKGRYNGLAYYWNSVLGEIDMDFEAKQHSGDKGAAELNNLQSKIEDEKGSMKGAVKDSKKLISDIVGKHL